MMTTYCKRRVKDSHLGINKRRLIVMIASIAKDTDGDGRDRNAAIHRVFSTPALSNSAMSKAGGGGNNGTKVFIDHALGLISAGSTDAATRASGYLLLDSILSKNTGGPHAEKICNDGRLSSWLDRLPTLYEGLKGIEVDSLLALFKTLLQGGGGQLESLHPMLQRALPKLINRISRVLKPSHSSTGTDEAGGGILSVQQCTMLAGLRLLTAIARSTYQNLLLSSIPTLCSTCVDALDITSVSPEAAELLGLLHSLVVPEQWCASWLTICSTLEILLSSHLGIQTLSTGAPSNNNNNNNTSEQLVTSLRTACEHCMNGINSNAGGCAQALHVEILFRSCCQVLSTMLKAGCSGGAVGPDLSILIPIFSTILSLRLPLISSTDGTLDPKALVSNEVGVTPTDIALVLPQCKLAVLSLISEL